MRSATTPNDDAACSPDATRYGLIQLASKQVMPNVLMALPLLRAGRVERHIVFHTDDPSESQRPASHLVNLLATLPGGESVAWVVEPVAPDAGHVYAAARAEIEEHGEVLRWILHVSGGTKTMAWGLMQLARHPRVEAVLYRELASGTWRRLRLADDGTPEDSPLDARDGANVSLANLLERPDAGLESLPLSALLMSQLAPTDALADPDESGRRQPRVRGSPAKPGVDAAAWLEAALHHGFALTAPEAVALPPQAGEGVAFECWLAHALVALGAPQAQWNVCVTDREGSPLIEFDAVACRGDRMLVLDLKLVGHDSVGKTAELRTAHQTAQWTGGRGAHTVVVRPNWHGSAPVREAARQLGVQLVVRDNLPELPRLAQEWLGLMPTATQRALADTLSQLLLRAVLRSARGDAVFRHDRRRPARGRGGPPRWSRAPS